jgi:hypothetical protein
VIIVMAIVIIELVQGGEVVRGGEIAGIKRNKCREFMKAVVVAVCQESL